MFSVSKRNAFDVCLGLSVRWILPWLRLAGKVCTAIIQLVVVKLGC